MSTNEVWNIFMLEYICLNQDPSPVVKRIFHGLSKEDAAVLTDYVI